jgi:hypothetical protein
MGNLKGNGHGNLKMCNLKNDGQPQEEWATSLWRTIGNLKKSRRSKAANILSAWTLQCCIREAVVVLGQQWLHLGRSIICPRLGSGLPRRLKKEFTQYRPPLKRKVMMIQRSRNCLV